MLAKIYLNDSKTENKIHCNFLISISERRRVMIAGNGEKCLVKDFTARNVDLSRMTSSLKKNKQVMSVDASLIEEKQDKIILERKPDCNCVIY